jgi:ribosomal protein S27AE
VSHQETFVLTRRVIRCPECGQGEFLIVSMHFGRSWGPWYCDDCGYGFTGRTDENGESFTEPWRDRKVKTVVTLRSNAPVVLRVEGMRFVPGEDGPEAADGHDEYYYNEHTCPTNFLGHPVLEVTDDDGTDDPHGIFAWVKTEVEEAR